MFFTSVIRCFSLFYFNFSLFAKKIIGSKGTSAVCYSAVNTSIMRIFASLTSQSMFCNCFILINMTMLNQLIADHLTSLLEESRITVVYNCSTLCNVGYLSYGWNANKSKVVGNSIPSNKHCFFIRGLWDALISGPPIPNLSWNNVRVDSTACHELSHDWGSNIFSSDPTLLSLLAFFIGLTALFSSFFFCNF